MLIPNLATKFVSLTSKAFKMAFWPLFFPLDKLMVFFSSKFLLHCFLYLFFLLIPNLAINFMSLTSKASKVALWPLFFLLSELISFNCANFYCTFFWTSFVCCFHFWQLNSCNWPLMPLKWPLLWRAKPSTYTGCIFVSTKVI